MKIKRLKQLFESSDLLMEAGYAKVLDLKYDDFENDPNPRVLYLGKFKHPETGNNLIGGINLNYLSDEEIENLRKNLKTIIRSGKRLKDRWAMGHQLLPDIFPGAGYQKGAGAYRTYKSDMAHIKSTGTITPLDDKTSPSGPVKPKVSPAIPSTQQTLDRAEQLADKPKPELPEPEVDKVTPVMPKRVSGAEKPVKPKQEPKIEKPAPVKPKRTSQIQADEVPSVEPEKSVDIEPELAMEPEQDDMEITPDDIPMPGQPTPEEPEEPEDIL